MNRVSLHIAIFFAFVTLATGQTQVWPLQKCIDMALEQSLENQIKQLEVKRTERAKTNMLHYYLPTIGLYGNHSYNFGSTIDPATNGRVSSNILYDNFYLNASVNLLNFNDLANQATSKLSVAKANAEKAVFENEYKLQIVESYYQALYTQELVAVAEQQLQNTQQNLNRIIDEVTLGKKPKSDEYDMKLSFKTEEKQLIENKQQLKLLKTQLFQLINKVDVLVDEVLLEETLAKTEFQTDTEFSNPKITLSEINYNLAQKSILSTKSNQLPTLSAFYQFSSFYYKPLNQPDIIVDNFSRQMGDNKNHQVGLQLSIPVFNGFKNSKQTVSAKIETEKSKTQIEFQKQELTKQINLESEKKNQYTQLQSQLQSIVEYAQLSYRTSQSKFESGKIEATTFTSVKNQLLQSQYDVLKNKLMLQFTDLKINLLQLNNL